MDAFYASVEMLDDPALRGKAVIVGGDSNRGVVSAASYEARKYGVHSALAIVIAKKRCPHGVFVRPRMDRYIEVSQQIMGIFNGFTPLVEPLSLDEAFLDVTGSEKLFGDASYIAQTIRQVVKQQTGLTVSAGLASSKLVAKIASDMDKPDGLTIVPFGKEREFLAPLPISKLWGVGKVTQGELAKLGVKTIGDLAQLSQEILQKKFGQHGTHLHRASMAIDDREVIPESAVKSIGHEDTFESDIVDVDTLGKKLLHISVKVARRLRRNGLRARTVMLKVKYYDFVQVTRSTTLKESTDDSHRIYVESKKLLGQTQAGKKPVRLVGISTANFEDGSKPVQACLFVTEKSNGACRRNLNEAVDSITDKYGRESLKPAALIDLKKRSDDSIK
nr:DNA polymerase IV [Desulfobulbaceae bacterium]